MNIEKINHSIDLIRKAERLALLMQQEHGFWLAFSGGKDSQCILELAKMAGVKFTAYYNVTTLDPPDNVRFIRNMYPDVKFIHPKETFLQLVRKKGILPTRITRYCCKELKETGGVGYTCIVGVRAAESAKRKNNGREVQKWAKTHKQQKAELERAINGVVELSKMEESSFQCVMGQDKINVNPILQWSDKDVWDFIRERNLPINPCYKTRNRVGCMFCPYASKREAQQDAINYPKYAENIKKEIATLIASDKFKSVQKYKPTADEIFDWWHSDTAIEDYFKILRTQTRIEFG